MFLTIHNLPPNIRYPEIKQLIQSKCGLAEVILDNLITEGSNKKVTVGLADENDAAILVRKINGLFVGGQQLYVEKTKQKQAEQPYRSSKDFRANEAYPGEMEHTSYGNSSNGQDSQNSYTNGKQNVVDANQRMYDSIQSMYTPNGQIMWDQAAMMMNIENTTPMGAMGTAGMMYMPPPNSFMGFGGQMQSQVPTAPQFSGFLENMGQKNQEDDREHGADRGNTHQSNNPPFDTPSNRGQNYRKHFDKYPEWDEPETQIRPVLPTSLDRWSRDSYSAEDNLQKNRDSGYGQRRETLGSEPFDVPDDRYDRESAGTNSRGFPHRQSASVNPWQKDSFATRSLIEENQEPFSSMFMNESFNEPWHQIPDVQRPSRQNLRFDKFDNCSTLHSRFDDPKPFVSRYNQDRVESFAPRSNQDYSERKTKWDRPNPAQGRPKARPLLSESVPGPRDRSAVSGEDKYIPKFYQDRRTHDEPPSKRLAGSTRSDTIIDRKKNIILNPVTQQRRPNPQGKPIVPPKPKTTMTNLLQRDITWRGQAASEIAKDMVARLGSVKNPPKNDPILVALRRAIRTRIDILVGNKKSVPMKEIIDAYRKKFDTCTDNQFYNAIVDSVKEEKQGAEGKATPQLSGISPVEAQNVNQLPIKQIQSEMQTPKKGKNIAAKSSDPQPSGPKAINLAKTKPGKNKAKPAPQVPKNKNKLPQYPFANKEMFKEQKKMQKLEMLSDCYELDAVSQKALDELADELCDIFMGECEGATTPNEIRICERISDHASDDFRKVIRLLVTKRLLNIKTNLQVRVYFNQRPQNSIMEQFTPFFRSVGAVSLKKSARKKNLFVVACNSYENYDALCAMEQAEVCGYTLTFKPLYVAGPGAKIPRSQVLAKRQQLIEDQVGTGAFLEKVEYPGHTKENLAQKKDDSEHDNTNVVEGDGNNADEWQLEDSQDAFYIDQAEGVDDDGKPQGAVREQGKEADDDVTPHVGFYHEQGKDADSDTPQVGFYREQGKDADGDTPQVGFYREQGKDADGDTPQVGFYREPGKDADGDTPQIGFYREHAEGADDDTHFPKHSKSDIDSMKYHEEEELDAPDIDDRIDENIPDVDNVNEDDLEEW